MDTREQRGQEIAALLQFRHTEKGWVVPSQSGKGSYVVNLDGDVHTCSCPDYELRQRQCKHIWAVLLALQSNNGIHEDTPAVLTPPKKPTYRQVWPAYNTAQTTEKVWIQLFLRDLCRGIQESKYTFGRPRFSI